MSGDSRNFAELIGETGVDQILFRGVCISRIIEGAREWLMIGQGGGKGPTFSPTRKSLDTVSGR